MGGPGSDPSEVCVQGCFDVWHLYTPKTKRPTTAELINAIIRGLAVLLRLTSTPNEFDLVRNLASFGNGRPWRAFMFVMRSKLNDSQWQAFTANLTSLHAFEEPCNETIARNILVWDDSMFAGITWGNLVIKPEIGTVREWTGPNTTTQFTGSSSIIIDILLTACWVAMGRLVSELTSIMHSVVFPMLCSGPNINIPKLTRCCRQILTELELDDTIHITDRVGIQAWKALGKILRTPGEARFVSFQARRLADIVNSIWIRVLAERMPFFQLTTMMLISTAITYFPKAGWTNFFDAQQEQYNEQNCGIMRNRLHEYVSFLHECSARAPLPFTIPEYEAADEDTKVQFLIRAWEVFRPMKNESEWQRQGIESASTTKYNVVSRRTNFTQIDTCYVPASHSSGGQWDHLRPGRLMD
ncbi:hypothetical protein D915_010768 [Fasciola hepatica]|uniref:Uncharacterized protein n=1 Tax=Fasciola hepatica TaxID=6192 RepID=A0A4E0QVX3_FASHE|nr:hypothetical protein D915_010768 [Fasciola hepatica]